jgi:hypothetical protein
MNPFAKGMGRAMPFSARVVLTCVGLAGIAQVASAEEAKKPGALEPLLAREAGTWDCDIKMYFKGPQGPPTEFKGVEENTPVCKGKFLLTKFKYAMGNRGTFEGHALVGYDSRSKKYVGTWVDSMITAPSQINAEYDEASHTLTDVRTAVGGGGVEFESKHVTKWMDNSSKTLTISMVVEKDGKRSDIKLFEMTAKKRES